MSDFPYSGDRQSYPVMPKKVITHTIKHYNGSGEAATYPKAQEIMFSHGFVTFEQNGEQVILSGNIKIVKNKD